ncbi:hypothetical protein DPEC_G00253950 [Dallia pectoralis]|uniref:Uncharacterized protein n=1 Tax=Dallia pectoralis TaxID=75939 RepID=A0ACC2FU48_DALPE|nr:hypothetical protein DPEC_G00253950 [Dallia pectoralis]
MSTRSACVFSSRPSLTNLLRISLLTPRDLNEPTSRSSPDEFSHRAGETRPRSPEPGRDVREDRALSPETHHHKAIRADPPHHPPTRHPSTRASASHLETHADSPLRPGPAPTPQNPQNPLPVPASDPSRPSHSKTRPLWGNPSPRSRAPVILS